MPPLVTWEGSPDYQPRPVLLPAAALYAPPVMAYAPQIVEERLDVPPGAALLAAGTPVWWAGAGLAGPLGTIAEVCTELGGDRVAAVVLESAAGRWLVPADLPWSRRSRGAGARHGPGRHDPAAR